MSDDTQKDHLLTNAQYDLLKKVVQLGLPALGTLYAGLAQLWNWPYAAEIVGSIALLTVFGGVLLGFSSRSYDQSDTKYDGEVVVNLSDPTKSVYDFQTSGPVGAIADKKEVIFKVQPPV
jgi:hypothetical protein